ncbi:MAG TPA: GGDEF domain-containing protein [Pyrinomonadaceae bacterium]|nr:GGDEF domain-containing protein [Pyrinomonadaceae bacterium]
MAKYIDEEPTLTTQVRESPTNAFAGLERRPVLVSLRGELIATPIPLERDRVIIGRALEADIRLNDFKASRVHAEIVGVVNNGTGKPEFRITDLGSTNGTFVNGQRISETSLNNGDKILIGDYLFRFDLLDEIDREFQQHIHRLLAHDDLTGLLTSKSFFTELRREAARSETESRPFCVLMMDLDHFKLVNDTYGHLTGNQVLEELGGIIRSALRSGDVAARFGGEEFAAFLLDAGYAQAIVAAERVRRDVEKHQFTAVHPGTGVPGERFHITMSIGVAACPDDGKDPIQLVELADSALYRAKSNGRNQTSAYQPSLVVSEMPLPPRRTS